MGNFIGTFTLKGALVAGTLSDNNIGNARFVRVVATAATNTLTVKDSAGATLGTAYLHAAGDEMTIEKAATDTITSSGAVSASAVAPRS